MRPWLSAHVGSWTQTGCVVNLSWKECQSDCYRRKSQTLARRRRRLVGLGSDRTLASVSTKWRRKVRAGVTSTVVDHNQQRLPPSGGVLPALRRPSPGELGPIRASASPGVEQVMKLSQSIHVSVGLNQDCCWYLTEDLRTYIFSSSPHWNFEKKSIPMCTNNNSSSSR